MKKYTDNVMLTTYDNPFNPFTEFNRWWKEDISLGHDCCGLLAKEAATSTVFSDEKNRKYIREAMERIVSRQPMIYKMVYAV